MGGILVIRSFNVENNMLLYFEFVCSGFTPGALENLPTNAAGLTMFPSIIKPIGKYCLNLSTSFNYLKE